MGSTPRGLYLKPGAAILTAPLPGGAPVFANPGDAIVSANGGGWHICIAPHAVPVEGLTPGASGDHFHWSQGPSYSGQGVPSSYVPPTFDAAQTGYGSDGRISGNGATGKPSW